MLYPLVKGQLETCMRGILDNDVLEDSENTHDINLFINSIIYLPPKSVNVFDHKNVTAASYPSLLQ